MDISIPVRRIALDEATDSPLAKGFILEYIVVDTFTIHVVLLTDKDPTLVSTDYIGIASEDFHRGGEVDDLAKVLVPIEEFGEFAGRIYTESVEWAIEEIEEFNEANTLVAALAAILPPAMDR